MSSETALANCLEWAAADPSGVLSPIEFNRRYNEIELHFLYSAAMWDVLIVLFESRDVSNDDISIKITHCGVCYGDVLWTKNAFGDAKYPLVPGYVYVFRFPCYSNQM